MPSPSRPPIVTIVDAHGIVTAPAAGAAHDAPMPVSTTAARRQAPFHLTFHVRRDAVLQARCPAAPAFYHAGAAHRFAATPAVTMVAVRKLQAGRLFTIFSTRYRRLTPYVGALAPCARRHRLPSVDCHARLSRQQYRDVCAIRGADERRCRRLMPFHTRRTPRRHRSICSGICL